MLRRIPPHILYPGLVIAILTMSVIAQATIVIKATSDNGAQIVDDYYAKAVDWDAKQARLAASEALGWQADLADLSRDDDGKVEVTIRLLDAEGQPLQGLEEANLQVRRPSRVEPDDQVVLEQAAPGVFRAAVDSPHHGLRDFVIEARRGEELFTTTLRRELSI